MSRSGPRRRPLLGCIADDFTGATDLASMLVANGMRTVQTIGVPEDDDSAGMEADAIVVALKSRTIPADEAVRQSLAVCRWLQDAGCEQFFFKYCSTFDSTPKGNIGPVTEALMAALGEDMAIACPALPVNGRTVYQGHLFVGHRLLNESGMQDHPLTPMRDADLTRVLGRQMTGTVGLIDHAVVGAGVEAVRRRMDDLRGEGVHVAIADAIADGDLRTLGAAVANHRLVTGGSGMAIGLPDNFRARGLLAECRDAAALPPVAGKAAVLSGSASVMTNRQVQCWLDAGRPAFRIDALRLAAGEPVVEGALAAFRAYGEPVLFYASCGVEELQAVQARLGAERAGALVEGAMASLAGRLKQEGVRQFVVAGGETSGAVVLALGTRILRIGRAIAPGVPATVSGDGEPLALALKSGNFGGPSFFDDALQALSGGACG